MNVCRGFIAVNSWISIDLSETACTPKGLNELRARLTETEVIGAVTGARINSQLRKFNITSLSKQTSRIAVSCCQTD